MRVFLFFGGLLACLSAFATSPRPGAWRMTMFLHEGIELPFTFDWTTTGNQHSMVIQNATERMIADEIRFVGDSVFIRMPFFDSEFAAKMEGDTRLKGIWRRNASRGRVIAIPFEATHGLQSRFLPPSATQGDLAPKWEVTFSPGHAADESKAIGLFYPLPDGRLGGSFATETGDYRYLEGDFDGTTLRLSCFDGCHVYLFTATLSGGILHGMFYAGLSHTEHWVAKANPDFELRDPDQLTFLKEGNTELKFNFWDLNGKLISLSDYRGKPVIVQLMGSWCPNCLDEARYFSELYNRYHPQGLEVIALAFEYSTDPAKATATVKRLRDRLGCEYTFCITGVTPDKADEALPMLNHVMSFPTSIFIDKSGAIRRIHTGFYGPGTGRYFDEFTHQTETLIEQMLR